MFHFSTARHPELGTKVLISTVMNGPMSSSGEHVCDPHEEQAGRASREHDPVLRFGVLTSDLDIRRGSTRPSVTPRHTADQVSAHRILKVSHVIAQARN